MANDPELPKHDELADEDDELGWDVAKHGRMVEYATNPLDEPDTVPLED